MTKNCPFYKSMIFSQMFKTSWKGNDKCEKPNVKGGGTFFLKESGIKIPPRKTRNPKRGTRGKGGLEKFTSKKSLNGISNASFMSWRYGFIPLSL